MDPQQYPTCSWTHEHAEFSFAAPPAAYNISQVGVSGISYSQDRWKPNSAVVQDNSYCSNVLPVNYLQSHVQYSQPSYWETECMGLESSHGATGTFDSADSVKPSYLSYPLDKTFPCYSTVPNGLQSNLLRYSYSQDMNTSDKESFIWRLERDNQSMRRELEECRKEIDRLRSLLSQGEPNRNQSIDTSRSQSRYWTPEEHQRFLEAVQKFGHKDVKAIANYVGSRTRTQVRTHAQKYFQRLSRESKSCNMLRSGKRCMSEPDLFGMERHACSSRCRVSVDDLSGEDSGSNNAQEEMTFYGKPPNGPSSGMELLSAVASSRNLNTSQAK